MGAHRSSPKVNDWLRKLEGLSGRKVGKHYPPHVRELAVSAIIDGVPRVKIIKALKISWSTLGNWHNELESNLRSKSSQDKAAEASPTAQVRSLAVTAPSTPLVQPHDKDSSTCIEINVSGVSIRILGRTAL
jgi:hypothetical protein